VSVSYAIPLKGPLPGLAWLSHGLWGNERRLRDSRQHVERLVQTLGDAAVRPEIADFVEDYAIFDVEAFTPACDAATLAARHAQTIAQILRGEPHTLPQQEIADARPSRQLIDPDASTVIGREISM